MASKANSANAIKWLSGDAFRGEANATMPVATTVPAGLFGDAPTNGATAMLAFGGIKAGFDRKRNRDSTDEDIFNNETDAPYYVHKGKKSETIAFEATDLKNKAVVLTMLLGGSIVEEGTSSGVFRWEEGEDEEFSLLLQLRAADGTSKNALWIPRCTLNTLPTDGMTGEELSRLPIELKPLAPTTGKAVQRYSNYNPLAP